MQVVSQLWTKTRLDHDDAPAGAFVFFGVSSGDMKYPLGLRLKCPNGCEHVMTLRFKRREDDKRGVLWNGHHTEPSVEGTIKCDECGYAFNMENGALITA